MRLRWRDSVAGVLFHQKARAFYAELRRPDGTLPMFGDTRSGESVVLATAPLPGGEAPEMQPLRYTRPARAFALLPVASHAVWWRGLEKWPEPESLAQTAVTWSAFPSNAHKLADDMSVILWSGGQTWVTNVGYWPYDISGRGITEGSWESANVLHLAGEPARSARVAELLAYSGDTVLTALDLRRRGPGAYVARRQILQFGSDLWLVLDRVEDEAGW